MKNLLIFFFLLISPILSATDYYVDQATGNDGNTGLTTGTAWKTISRAVYISELDPGDVVYVRTGTYTEQLLIYQIAGTALNPIIIQNYPTESPIIDGSGISCGVGSSLVRIYGNYIHFIGFHIQNGDQAGIITTGTNTLMSQCTIHNMQQNAIIMVSDADYSIAEYITAYNLCMSNSDGVWQLGEIWATGISAARQPDYCIIRHCIVHDVWGEAISTYEATNTTIEDNIVYDHYSVGIYVSDATDCLVQRNLIYETKDMGDGSQVGFGHWNEGQTPQNARNTFINNICYGAGRNFYIAVNGIALFANNTSVNSAYFASVQLTGTNSEGASFVNNMYICRHYGVNVQS
jgi:parallel beta-helix repeat protein